MLVVSSSIGSLCFFFVFRQLFIGTNLIFMIVIVFLEKVGISSFFVSNIFTTLMALFIHYKAEESEVPNYMAYIGMCIKIFPEQSRVHLYDIRKIVFLCLQFQIEWLLLPVSGVMTSSNIILLCIFLDLLLQLCKSIALVILFLSEDQYVGTPVQICLKLIADVVLTNSLPSLIVNLDPHFGCLVLQSTSAINL